MAAIGIGISDRIEKDEQMIHGLLLAAGSGTRMGMPKALVEDESGAWLTRSVNALLEGGCSQVTVVLGASADAAEAILTREALSVELVHPLRAAEWHRGMGASLKAGLDALFDSPARAALIHLVDLPDVEGAVVQRVLRSVGPQPEDALVRAGYLGDPGHPVLVGRHHWRGITRAASADQGARTYLKIHHAVLVECGDLATGRDVDTR